MLSNGTSLKVNTINGTNTIQIPPKTKNADQVKIPNLGVNYQGNHIVNINVSYPEDISSLINALKG